ncbi:MAG TPA: hypothetical protein VIA07_00755 [Desulfuromonadales bacterium]|jgi:hypothetical protein
MHFNSYEFFLVFLPATLTGYLLLNRCGLRRRPTPGGAAPGF